MSGDPLARKRQPWPGNFPDVEIHTDVKSRDRHAFYLDAKSGDARAALRLAADMLSRAAVERLEGIIAGRKIMLLPVTAEEVAGFNAIPDAMAQLLGQLLDQPVNAGEIVQTNKVGHTRAKAFQRLVTPAEFGGDVIRGANYVLVDDHVGLSGTLANLRGFVEARGARIIAMTTLTEGRDGRQISLRSATLHMLRELHGNALDQFWQSQYGYSIDCLTDVEAQILCRQPTLVAIENFLAQAAVEARGRGLETAPGTD